MVSLTEYQDDPIRDIINQSIDWQSSDILVFVMGPYRLLDPSYLYPERDFSDLPPDPLAPDPDRDDIDRDKIEHTLRELCKRLSEQTRVTAFIASDVEIPTKGEVNREDLDEPGMTVINQSIAFASASEGSAFVFTKAGLTTGVGAESGAIPEYFNLRSPANRARSPKTFCIFEEAKYDPDTEIYEPKFGSASIDEMDMTYDIPFRYFADKEDLMDSMISFVESHVVPSTLS